MSTFDYVIIGAGTAGCIMAYRLAEQGHSVCIIEAGPPDRNPFIKIPAGIMKTAKDRKITWQFVHQGTANTYGREIPFIQGKTLGGSGAINGMVHSRGQVSDFDGWARLGAEGWDYASVLPYFRKYERFAGGEDAYRGREGRVPISVLGRREQLVDSFINGAVETGIPLNPDYNGRTQHGVNYTQATISGGRRWNSAHAYLHPARRRWGVHVITDAQARRIVVSNGRATGVEYSRTGSEKTESVQASREVILSAGSVNSPKLLQLSGIGPSKLLQDLGIPVVHDLPGVGENLSDHYAARLVARVHKGLHSINEQARGLSLLTEIASWMMGRPSILAMSSMAAYAFCKMDSQATDNAYAITFTPVSLKLGDTRRLDDFPGITSGAWQLRPVSRGYIRIQSKDYREAPLVQPNYLDAECDRLVMVEAMKRGHAILRSRAMSNFVEQIVLPADECRRDDEWLDYVRRYGMTCFHLVGTCTMGASTDPKAVVDPHLRVRGISGLRVVDASVLPTTPSANTNASTAMVAEKAAALIEAEKSGVR